MRWRCAAWLWPASFRSPGGRWPANCNATGPARQRARRSPKFSPITAAAAASLTPGSCNFSARRRAPAPEPERGDGTQHSQTNWRQVMTSSNPSEAAKAVVRRNTEEVQSGGNFEVFEELFADDFLDHTPQPGRTPDKDGARQLYKILRTAFPDFHADIHWQLADGDRVTTYKTYHGTHRGEFLGVAPTGRKIQFETVDVMRVRDGKITEHWGVANLFSLMQQLGAWPVKQDHA